MSSILMFLGLLIALGGGIWFLVIAFKEHILWGLGCLLVPFVSLVFLFMHFGKSWRPFALQVLGMLIMIPAVMSTAAEVRSQQMVEIRSSAALNEEQMVDVLTRLQSQGIKATLVLNKIYVKSQDRERAEAVIAAAAQQPQ